MTLTPYSISESTKISEAYLNNVLNEASAKWGTQVVNDIIPIADKPKTAQDYIAPSVEQITRDNEQAQHAMRNIDYSFAPPVQRKHRQTYISAAPPSSNENPLVSLRDIRKRGDISLEDVLLSVTPVGRVAKVAKVAKNAGVLGNFFKGTGKALKNTTGKAITGTAKFIKKNPIITSPLTTSAGVYLDQKLNDGKVADGVKTLYNDGKTLYNDGKNALRTLYYDWTDTSKPEERQSFEAIQSMQNSDQVISRLDKHLQGVKNGTEDALTHSATGSVYQTVAPFVDQVNMLKYKEAQNFVNAAKKLKAAGKLDEVTEKTDDETLIRELKALASDKPVVIAPYSKAALKNVSAKLATGQVNNQFPGVTLDPSAKSWSDNVKDFVFSNPYVTAGIITIPLITYIISKYGASLVNAIKGDGGNDKISGKEFVIVDNGKYLHSNGFSKTISKDIAIFKNKQDAQSAITTLNTVKPSNYKIEELEKVIG